MNKEAEKLIEDFCEVIKNNEKFLREYAEETYNECIELINDAIDYAFKNKENYTNSFYFFFKSYFNASKLCCLDGFIIW